jgi:alanine-synthesizing transaminase
MFSSRLRQGPGRNRLTLALDRRRLAGLPIADLTESNPTRAGFTYPADLLAALGQPSGLLYDPRPFGLATARQAVADDFKRRGVAVAPERIVLTASTSEAYSFLLKLLCDPGDIVLAPRPSYPLMEHLADLDAVAIEPYSMEFHGRWSLDVEAIAKRLAATPTRIRAIIIVSPNNPTGSVLKPSELAELAELARRHEVALIADEVFADYPSDSEKGPGTFFDPSERKRYPDPFPSVLAQDEALSFGLGGLSKCVGLPQVKLGWIGVSGPSALVAPAMERLETICDTYLSVSTPVQVAAAKLLKEGAVVRTQIQRRVSENDARLRAAAGDYPACSVLPIEGGWYAVVQVPAIRSEEALVVDLLEHAGVLVHPGYFFDFEREAFLVLSLLPAPVIFSAAVDALLSEVGRLS